MMRYGKPLKPLNIKVDGLPGVEASSSKDFRKDYQKAKKQNGRAIISKVNE